MEWSGVGRKRGAQEWSSEQIFQKMLEWRAERRAGVTKLGLSAEQQIGHSRSAHMIWCFMILMLSVHGVDKQAPVFKHDKGFGNTACNLFTFYAWYQFPVIFRHRYNVIFSKMLQKLHIFCTAWQFRHITGLIIFNAKWSYPGSRRMQDCVLAFLTSRSTLKHWYKHTMLTK